MSLNLKKEKVLNNLGLTKKYHLLKKVNTHISTLKNLLSIEHRYKDVNLILPEKTSINSKKFLLTYIICFSFSPKNTLLHIMDAWGNLKFRYSAGLIGITGQQKKNRILVLSRLFTMLKKAKITFLKTKPVALHLYNVGSYKHFIVKKLKSDFFIRVVKSYETYPYNGCRSKKRLHTRQRSKKRK